MRIASRLYERPSRSLVAEIRAWSRPNERIVMVAHVQEPGANDNASGCATQYGMARALLSAIDLLSELHLAVCQRRARDTGWIVRTNPDEGGSDHTVFGAAGVPSLLNWHFTDRYYRTNQDRPDKVSVAEMENVGVSVATSARFLAAAGERDALALVELLARAASERLTLERRQGPEVVSKSAKRENALEVERRVQEAWVTWYREALDSVVTLPVPSSDADSDAVTAAQSRVR